MSRKRGSAGFSNERYDGSGRGDRQRSRDSKKSGDMRGFGVFTDFEGGANHGVSITSESEDNGSFLPNQEGLLTSPTATSSKKSNNHTMSSDDSASETYNLDTNTYDAIKVIGHGSFGCVFLAKVLETGQMVAIKKVLQNRKFKNRELHIMKAISNRNTHPFIVHLMHYFLSSGKDKAEDGRSEIYLNLVLEYIPETLYSLTKQYGKQRQKLPIEHVRVYMYQLVRALAHIHSRGVCHRDIKPQNLLIDSRTLTLKLCDFGSSKILVKDEPNVAYICSRYYRAPELIFGSNDYTTIIDLWSFGCVMAEVLMGSPIFPGNTGVDHLVEIIKVLGAPNKEDLKRMNPSYQEFKFPNIRAHNFVTLFPAGTDREAIDIVASLLKYLPESRSTAIQLVFDDFFLPRICAPGYLLPTGKLPPPSFSSFTLEEKESAAAAGITHPLLTQGESMDRGVVRPVSDDDLAGRARGAPTSGESSPPIGGNARRRAPKNGVSSSSNASLSSADFDAPVCSD